MIAPAVRGIAVLQFLNAGARLAEVTVKAQAAEKAALSRRTWGESDADYAARRNAAALTPAPKVPLAWQPILQFAIQVAVGALLNVAATRLGRR